MKSQSGFTLVELAIVLMIIGLLIGGILKGQEMIANTRILTTISQLKSYNAALITFQDTYNATPGDMLSPSTRLSNCSSSPCSTAGNGDGMAGGVSPGWGANTSLLISEQENFWRHLIASGIASVPLPDVTPYVAVAPVANFFVTGANFANTGSFSEYARPFYGQYIIIKPIPAGTGLASPADSTTNALASSVAGRIDQKMDDSFAYTGDILTTVYTGDGTTSTSCSLGQVYHSYNYTNSAVGCVLAFKAGVN